MDLAILGLNALRMGPTWHENRIVGGSRRTANRVLLGLVWERGAGNEFGD